MGLMGLMGLRPDKALSLGCTFWVRDELIWWITTDSSSR